MPDTNLKGRRAAAQDAAGPHPDDAQPAIAPEPRVRTRRRPLVFALAVALAVIGALGGAWALKAGSSTQEVLALSQSVSRGEVITAKDLTTVSITAGQEGLSTVAADKSRQLIGKSAVTDMPEGTLLSASTVAANLTPPKGKTIVGVALKPAQMPGEALTAGDHVRIIDTPVSQADPPSSTDAGLGATVVSTRRDTQSRVTVVDVEVPSEKASNLAARAATGRVALALDSPQAGA